MMPSKVKRRRIRGILQDRFGVRYRDPEIDQIEPDETLRAVRALGR